MDPTGARDDARSERDREPARGRDGTGPAGRAEIARLEAEARELRAQRRAELARDRAAAALRLAQRARRELETDRRIREALSAGKSVREVVAALRVGPHRVLRVRAALALGRESGAESTDRRSGPPPAGTGRRSLARV